ncbi:MAG TPA: hypothetical protein PKD49_07645 [Hyphomicrobium sp.]|nr:hypothetical protein [Hyphomicrobium sp.]
MRKLNSMAEESMAMTDETQTFKDQLDELLVAASAEAAVSVDDLEEQIRQVQSIKIATNIMRDAIDRAYTAVRAFAASTNAPQPLAPGRAAQLADAIVKEMQWQN